MKSIVKSHIHVSDRVICVFSMSVWMDIHSEMGNLIWMKLPMYVWTRPESVGGILFPLAPSCSLFIN